MNPQDQDKGHISTVANPAAKRTGHSLPSPRRKRAYSPPESELRKPIPPNTGHNARWLIESTICARVLGPGGKRFKHMKESTKDRSLLARISPNVSDAEFRVFNCSGSAMSISKMAGLLVRYIYDEPENERSHAESCRYDFKLLIPKVYAPMLTGTQERNLREIEGRSNASLHMEKESLPVSDETCLHVFGVADAIQIATYFILESLKTVEDTLRNPFLSKDMRQFDPTISNQIYFKVGKVADPFPKARVTATSSSHPYQHDRPTTNTNASKHTELLTDTGVNQRNGNLKLPDIEDNINVPQSIYTAYDIARDSQRSILRQIVQMNSAYSGTEADRAYLIENIQRVTTCRIEQGTVECVTHFVDDLDEGGHDISFILEGPPSENSMALLLIYRFLKKCIPS